MAATVPRLARRLAYRVALFIVGIREIVIYHATEARLTPSHNG